MHQILLFIIIVVVLVALVSGLIYVGSKLIFNVSNDLSNDPNNQQPTTSQNMPNVSQTSPSTSTSVLKDNTLEVWSENNFQGTKSNISLGLLEDGFNIIASSNAKSIRFPSTGYDVYIMTQQQFDTAILSGNISDNYSQNSLKIEANTPLINVSINWIVIIKIPLPTTTELTTPTTTKINTDLPPNSLQFFDGENYTGNLIAQYDMNNDIIANGGYLDVPNLSSIKSIRWNIYGLMMYGANTQLINTNPTPNRPNRVWINISYGGVMELPDTLKGDLKKIWVN
jgi:hypothetical protein